MLAAAGCGQAKPEETKAAETGASETEAELEEVPFFSAFDYEDLTKYVTIGTYKGIELDKIDTTVTEEDIDQDLESKLEEYNTMNPQYEEIKDRAVAEGDTVNLDYCGTMEGEDEPFQGGTGEGFLLKIGSGQFIPGFEDQLIGVMPGEEVDVKVTFPDEYPNDPTKAGKPAVFKCTVNFINGEQIMKEMNDEFIKELTDGEYKTLAEFREYDRKALEDSKTNASKQEYAKNCWNTILEGCEFKDEPTEIIEFYEYTQQRQLQQTLEMYGIDLETYCEYMGATVEEFNQQMADSSVQMAHNDIVIASVVKAEKAELSKDDLSKGIEDLAASVGATKEQVIEAYGEGYLHSIVYQDFFTDWMLDNAIVLK